MGLLAYRSLVLSAGLSPMTVYAKARQGRASDGVGEEAKQHHHLLQRKTRKQKLALRESYVTPENFDAKPALAEFTASLAQKFPKELEPLIQQGRFAAITRDKGVLSDKDLVTAMEEETVGDIAVNKAPRCIALIGTGAADENGAAVKLAIEALKPDKIMLATCTERAAALNSAPKLQPRTEAHLQILQMLWTLIQRGEPVDQATLNQHLDGVMMALTGVDLHPCADMSTAVWAAQEFGAEVYLGDQHVSETKRKVGNMLANMDPTHKLQLLSKLTTGAFELHKRLGRPEPVQAAAAHEPAAATGQASANNGHETAAVNGKAAGVAKKRKKSRRSFLAREAPELSTVLMDERAAHMAYNLKWHAHMQGAKLVIGVVPTELVRGITYHLLQDVPAWANRPSSMTKFDLLPAEAPVPATSDASVTAEQVSDLEVGQLIPAPMFEQEPTMLAPGFQPA
ncbi:hypothetical protein WJX73_002277 [Symbiochloris irregularis]|uniref:Uncharacterized protein n=1 Tax=Symbiochloris irregularis TaxID=706552 RepID=A0AAW1NUA6_9CHLO